MTCNKIVFRLGCGLFFGALLSACSHTPPRTALKVPALPQAVNAASRPVVDGAPDKPLTEEEIAQLQDAVPMDEPLSKYGNNSPYTVNGETYRVMSSARGFKEKGLASWYGRKFHGQRTSSGEAYDMYKMTAAHKHLPIPCYARIINLDNGKSIIVKVNDRGPFHSERVMDMSWAAAAKLGMLGKGTANISLEVVDPADYQQPAANVASRSDSTAPAATTAASSAGQIFIQAGAFGNRDNAAALQSKLQPLASGTPVAISSSSDAMPIHRVQIGPFDDEASAEKVRSVLRDAAVGNPIIVRR